MAEQTTTNYGYRYYDKFDLDWDAGTNQNWIDLDAQLFLIEQSAFEPAIGQAGINLPNNVPTQAVTATPAPMAAFNNAGLAENIGLTLSTNVAQYTVAVGAAGIYEFDVTIALSGTSNDNHVIEIYVDGSPTNLISVVDLNNSQTTSGSCSLIGKGDLAEGTTVDLYIASGSASTVTYASCTFGAKKIGQPGI